MNAILFQVYDGLNVSSPLLLTILENSHHHDIIPPPVFSTGPSLTMAFRSTNVFQEVLDISYTSTDQGTIIAIMLNYDDPQMYFTGMLYTN